MARVCTNCGTEAAEGDRFCSTCGTALETGEGAERKLATMVFVDLVGSTEIAAGSDPEDLRGRLEPFFETARASLREHGGTIEKYVGDAVLAVFGVPQAHGDDPDRAIAAALDLAERVATLDQALAVRIGIEAGEVLAQDGGGDLSVTGEAVNSAARLQQAAAPGEVLVGERAARYCRRATLEPQGDVEAKGMPEPLRSWRALESSAASEEPISPMIGRDNDLELLRLVYRRSVRERVPELVIVTGEAGIGKTRLASELVAELRSEDQAPRVLIGRNPPYGRGIAFWALAEILRDAAGMGEDASVVEVESSLASLLERLGAEDSREIAAALSVALGGEGIDLSGVGEDELKHAWRRFVALLAEERPLVLGIDDAHWADDGLLDLLEEAAFRVQSAPLLLLCTSRPELAERRPDFGRTTRNVTQVELRPLQPLAATELIELLLPDEAKELAPRAAEASGGNPFFAEEVARRILEEPGSALAEDLPDTVQAAIAARIDLLPANEKCALQFASVLGHSFGRSALTDLLGDPADEPLAGLERRALVQERLAAGPGHYRFRHQLTRDVAYSSLPRAERATLHERAAEGIRGRSGKRIAELAELVAFHLTRAAELDPTPERANVAFRATFGAADSAARRGAVARAQELFEKVAGLDLDDRDRIEPLRAAADLALRRWRGDQALPLLREEAAAAERAGDPGAAASAYARAVEVAARMSGITGLLPEAELTAMLRKGQDLVPDEDRATRTQLLLDEVWIAWVYDRPEEMTVPAEQALELAREIGDPVLLSSALDAATADDWNRGHQRNALKQTTERLELIEQAPPSHALEMERSDALHMMIECLLQTGDFREAARYAAQARELDHSRGVEYSAWERELLTTFFLGEWDRTLEMGARFREEWNAAGGPPIAAMCTAVGTVGAIIGYRGDAEKSREWFEFTRNIAPDLGAGGQMNGMQMLQADVALHCGRLPEAAEMVAEARVGQWWGTPFLATRAEAFVLTDDPRADKALAEAADRIGEYLYAQGILMRAQGLAGRDEALLRESLALFEQLECPYQAARSGWLIGGEAKEVAGRTFERLGAAPPS
jgi:class 3 adenylate cyclase/tetratricopeptide (TPR) repeat protein